MKKSESSDISISIVIPVYRGGEEFRQCMEAVLRAVPKPDEIIVVADGDLSGTPLSPENYGIRIIVSPVQGGPAKTRNIGACAAKGKILFFVDADVIIEPDSITKIRDVFQQNPDLAAVFGSYDDTPAKTNFLSQYRNLLHHYVHQNGREDASTFWAACGAIRREVFLTLTGFNETLYRKPAIEDIELGYRLKKAGYKIRLHKSLQVKHLKSWGIVSIIKTDFFQRALPWARLILRDRQFVNDLNIDVSSRLSVVSIFGLILSVASAGLHGLFLLPAGIFTAILIKLNASLYQFFRRKRGWWFALRTIPWHWLYFLYSGIAFAVSLILYSGTSGKKSSQKLVAEISETSTDVPNPLKIDSP